LFAFSSASTFFVILVVCGDCDSICDYYRNEGDGGGEDDYDDDGYSDSD